MKRAKFRPVHMSLLAAVGILAFGGVHYAGGPSERSSSTPALSTAESVAGGLVNGSRLQDRRHSLYTERLAAACARTKAEAMRRAGYISHSSDGELRACLPDAKLIGENLGVGQSLEEIHSLMLGSTSHRHNITGDYRYLGPGVIYDGNYWLAEWYWR